MCKHETKHTQMFFDGKYVPKAEEEFPTKGTHPQVIITWCAECGERLFETHLKEEENLTNKEEV